MKRSVTYDNVVITDDIAGTMTVNRENYKTDAEYQTAIGAAIGMLMKNDYVCYVRSEIGGVAIIEYSYNPDLGYGTPEFAWVDLENAVESWVNKDTVAAEVDDCGDDCGDCYEMEDDYCNDDDDDGDDKARETHTVDIADTVAAEVVMDTPAPLISFEYFLSADHIMFIHCETKTEALIVVNALERYKVTGDTYARYCDWDYNCKDSCYSNKGSCTSVKMVLKTFSDTKQKVLYEFNEVDFTGINF